METKIVEPTDESITTAATLLLHDQIVAFPTETVYGLGANIFNETAIQKIFEVKGRPSDNPLIAHISSLKQVEQLSDDIPHTFYEVTDAFSPGPITLVIHKKSTVPDIASAHLSTIGVRMPSHPVALKLIDMVGSPLVAPSANISGKPSPTTAQHVFDDLQGKIPLILDGGSCDVGIESTVLDLTVSPPIILRPGHISKEQLEKVLGMPVLFPSLDTPDVVKAPGMKYRHYAPMALITIVTTMEELSHTMEKLSSHQTMLLTNVHLPPTYDFEVVLPVTEKTLYASFRRADSEHLQHIVVFLDEETKKYRGLLNRLEKAAKKV